MQRVSLCDPKNERHAAPREQFSKSTMATTKLDSANETGAEDDMRDANVIISDGNEEEIPEVTNAQVEDATNASPDVEQGTSAATNEPENTPINGHSDIASPRGENSLNETSVNLASSTDMMDDIDGVCSSTGVEDDDDDDTEEDDDEDVTVILLDNATDSQRRRTPTTPQGYVDMLESQEQGRHPEIQERRRLILLRELRRVQQTSFMHFLLLCVIPAALLMIVIATILGESSSCGNILDPSGNVELVCSLEARTFMNAFTTRCICDSIEVPKSP